MKRQYINSFVGLRSIAAGMVFLAHTGFGAGFGSFGVNLFFTLSGFLAQRRYCKAESEEKESVFRECCRSAGKGYRKFLPLHIPLLLCAAILTYKTFLETPLATVLRFLANGLLLQSWSPNRTTNISFNNLTWYLSALMLCMFLSPALVRFFGKLGKRAHVCLLAAIVALQFGAALLLEPLSQTNFPAIEVENYRQSVAYWLLYICPPIRVLDYSAGCLLSVLGEEFPARSTARNSILLVLSALLGGVALFFCYGRDFMRIFDVAVWSLPSWGIVLSLSREEKLFRPIGFLFTNIAVKFGGTISFEFYMVHELVIRCARYGFRLIHVESRAIFVISSLIASVIGATCLHFLKSYLEKRREKPKELQAR